MIQVALIRHGPTGWNEVKRLQGRTDIPLSEAGRAQVATWRLPKALHEFEWVASPLCRAAETAAMLGLTPAVENAIVEMDWGDWEGSTFAELQARYGDEVRRRAALGLDLRPHNGESPRDVRERVRAWLVRVAKAGRPTGAVAHQGIIRAALSLATGWEMIGEPPAKMDWASAHLFAVEPGGAVRIDRLNVSLVAEAAAE